jgi:hypothetical protein
MAAYGADGRCLMRVLQEELDYPDPQDCGRCSVCTEARFGNPPDASLVELAQRHLVEVEARLARGQVELLAAGRERVHQQGAGPISSSADPAWPLRALRGSARKSGRPDRQASRAQTAVRRGR